MEKLKQENNLTSIGGQIDCRVIQPFYNADGICLYKGDNRKVMKALSPYDLIVTDIPYGVNKAEWDGIAPTKWIKQALKLAPRLLVMTGNSALIFVGNKFGDLYKDLIILRNKNGMTRSKIAFGNYIPVIAVGDWKWQARPNVIDFVVRLNENIKHPSPKPLEAMKKLLHHYCEPNWKILDPFAGSGTTLLAAKELGLSADGIEIEENYCDEIIGRLSQTTMQFNCKAV